MFKNLMTKIKTDLERDQTSNNGSICSSVSSSRLDLKETIRPRKTSQSILETVPSHSESSTENVSNDNLSTRTPDYLPNALDECHIHQFDAKDDIKSTESSKSDLISKRKLSDFEETNSETTLSPTLNLEDVSLNHMELDSKLLQENQLLKEKLNSLQTVSSKIEQLEQEKDNFWQELKQLRRQNHDLAEKNEELKKSNMDNEERNTKILNKMDELKNKNRQLTEKNKDLLEKNQQLKDKQEVLIKNIDHLEINFAKVSKEKLALEERLEQITEETVSEEQDKPNENDILVAQLQEKITKLEETLTEKNKTIRLQNQRIHDIKKSVQKGDLFLRDDKHNQDTDQCPDSGFNSGDQINRNELQKQIKPAANNNNVSNSDSNSLPTLNNKKDYQTHLNDINFQYLHNVIFKFITSYDYEAQKQLVKAISTLLKFSEEEERVVKQSLQAKGSWFRLSESLKF